MGYVFGSILVSLTLILGIAVTLHPPKDREGFYGFRTGATLDDDESWRYGNKVGGITLLVYSVFSISLFVTLLTVFRAFFDKFFYLRIVLGIVLLAVGGALAMVVVQVKTHQFQLKRIMKKMKEESEKKAIPDKEIMNDEDEIG